MDRHDEHFEDKEEKLRQEGDVLGLGGADVPQTPADRALGGASSDPDDVRRWRELKNQATVLSQSSLRWT